MCFGVCVISFIIVFSDFLVTRESRRKARRVTIASATFDKSGRVLVNPDGMLPMGEVETDFPLKVSPFLFFSNPCHLTRGS
jgi:hypothetical protein